MRCMSTPIVAGEVGNAAPSLLPMSNFAYIFVPVLSSNSHHKHRFTLCGTPTASLWRLSLPLLELWLLVTALYGQLPPIPVLYQPAVALSGPSAALSAVVRVCSGGLHTSYLALSGQTMGLCGLPPLCLGWFSPVVIIETRCDAK